MDRARRNLLLAALLVVVFAAAAVALVQFGRSGTDPAPPPAAGQSTPSSGLPTVTLADLPAKAASTLTLIDEGGPFPYSKDGSTFRNDERMLPSQPRGYYREYTVPTPGSRDRGARRFVVGRDGDVYYTADHYESFRQVLR